MLGCIQPMSSPMMNKMFGFCCCCAVAGVPGTDTAAHNASRPSQAFLGFITNFLHCWLLRDGGGSHRPSLPPNAGDAQQAVSMSSVAMAGNRQQPCSLSI